MNTLQHLREQYPWPSECPDLPFNRHGWLAKRTRQGIQMALWMQPETELIVEVGSYLGKSSRFILDYHPADLICIDIWSDDIEHTVATGLDGARSENLYQQFLANCWDYRDRMLPIRCDSIDGLGKVWSAGLKPGVIYIDAGHDFEHAYADINRAMDLFPNAVIVGDDYGKKDAGVKKAVLQIEKERKREKAVIGGYGWLYYPAGRIGS